MMNRFASRVRVQRCFCLPDKSHFGCWGTTPSIDSGLLSQRRVREQYHKTFIPRASIGRDCVRYYSTQPDNLIQTDLCGKDAKGKGTQSKMSLTDCKKALLNEQPAWFSSLIQKQRGMCTHLMLSKSAKTIGQLGDIENNSNLQHFLAYITDDKIEENDYIHTSKQKSHIKPLSDKSVEAAFTIVIHTILKATIPQYTNRYLKVALDQAVSKYKLKPSKLFISQETLTSTAFKQGVLPKLIDNKEFQLAVQLLKVRLGETHNWKPNVECRDDNVVGWINALVEPSVTKSLLILTKSKHIPDIIAYDLLTRIPANELEFRYFFEFYKSLSTQLNFIDQEKLFHMRSLGEGEYERSLQIPPLFNNLFRYALRSSVDKLLPLIELFLKENNVPSEHTMMQHGELIWELSYDHTGEHLKVPSRYYQLAQSRLIQAVNSMTKQNRALEVDVVTMLGVSNMAWYKDGRKAFAMFKNAKKQFDHWQLREFKPDDFKEVVSESVHSNNVDSQSLYNTKIDYNIRFLCNSIILLAVNEQNAAMIVHDLLHILSSVEPQVLEKYPEVWSFVVIKLAQHDLILNPGQENTVARVYDEYFRYSREHGVKHPFVVDYVINRTGKVRTLFSVLENLGTEGMDDNNRAHMISRLYKLAKIQARIEPTNDVVQTYDCLSTARRLYDECIFKSTRMNSSHLLGEAIFTPAQTYERYNSVNEYFKITQLSIASLFVAVYKLRESGDYANVRWGDQEPLNYAMEEFEKNISKSYGDTDGGLLYPNDRLLTIYASVLRVFSKKDEAVKLFQRLVDLKYPVSRQLFESVIEAVPSDERRELLRCLDEYDERFEKLRSCKSEYELRRMKKLLSTITTKGAFESFVQKLEFNWGVVGRWQWPGRKQKSSL